ncbi:MAG: NUDIX domain-containing protein [Nanoarchaeota archaeon]|nr:NUDIX domain-containing protein [Nanoarchaeota archaeon]
MKYRNSIFALVYLIKEKNVEYLILKRKLHWKGWEFPKGAIERFETKKGAVKREVFEETGLSIKREDIKKFEFSGKYKYNKVILDRSEFKGQSFSLYSVEVKKGKVRVDNYEHSDYKWVGFEKALKMLTWSNQKKSLKIVNEWLENEIQKKNS